jgi:hypothetical protein
LASASNAAVIAWLPASPEISSITACTTVP